MNNNNAYGTLAEAHMKLREKGYDKSFEVREDETIKCTETGETFSSDDICIDEYHRFEGASDPSDMAVIYAISSATGCKGTLIDAYGTYSSRKLGNFIKDISTVKEKAVGNEYSEGKEDVENN